MSESNGAAAQPASTAELASELPAQAWSAAQRLLALDQTHGLAGTELNTWYLEKCLFEGKLVSWRDAFCAATPSESRDSKLASRELQVRNEGRQRDLRQKERPLAEAAAFLVLQIMFQVLWEDEQT